MTQATSLLSGQFARAGRFLRSPMFPIFMIVFVDMLGLGIILPVLPLYAQNLFQASALQITLLQSAYFVAQFFAAPYLGRLSDRVGRRPVLILSQSGTLTAFLVSGLASALPFLYLARIVDGLTGGNISVAQAYLSDITDEHNRARGLGIVHAGFASGFIFGPAFGAFMAAQFGPRAPFFIAACVSLLTITLSIFLLPESLTPERRREVAARQAGRARLSNAGLLRLPGMALLMVVAFGGEFAFLNFQSIYVLWAEKILFAGRDPQFVQQAVGGILTFVGVCGIITQFWLVAPLVRRFGEKRMVAAGNLIRCFAWITMTLAPIVVLVVAVTPMLAVGNGVLMPALIALVTYTAPPDQRGQAIGLSGSIQGLGRVLGPVMGGLLFQYVHPSAPIVAATVIGLLTFAVTLGLRTRQPQRASVAEQQRNPVS